MNSYPAVEDRITEALASINPENSKPNIKELAKKFAVPYRRLLHRSKGRPSRSQREPVNLRLNDTEELALCRFLDIMEESGLYARTYQIERIANSILSRRPGPPEPPVGPTWPTRFLRRHPEYFTKKQRTLDIERKESHERRDIEVFFERWKKIIEKYGINPADTYNFDETGFRIGMGRHQKIITRDPKARPYIESSTNRESITLIEAVSGDGYTLPPMVILSATTHRENWYPPGLEDNYLVGVSDSGYSNDELGLRYIEHFNKFTKDRRCGQYRLLLFDHHESHETYEFLKFCDDEKIIPFGLPPHSTHFLQPLDVAVFQPFKHWHGQELDEAARTGCKDFNRVEFLDSLATIRKKTFKKRTILKSWRETGLIPYNPDLILNHLQYENKEDERRRSDRQKTPTPSTQSSNNINTPKTVRTMTRYGNKILNGPESHSHFQKRLDSFIKGSIAIAHLAEDLKDDLSKSKAAQQAREERRKSRRRVFQSGGVLYAEEARHIRTKRDEDEVEVANGVLERAKKKELRARMAKAKRLAIDCKKHRRELIKHWKASNEPLYVEE
jgi:hypothetical protein